MGRRMTPPRVCLPLSSLQDEQYATIWRSLDLFMHQTCAIPYIMKQKICHQWSRESWTIYPPSASCIKMFPPCTTPMYINNVPKDIIHEMYPPYANMCIYQYANMFIYQHAKQCASINMLNKYHPWVYHHTSLLAPSKYINHASIS